MHLPFLSTWTHPIIAEIDNLGVYKIPGAVLIHVAVQKVARLQRHKKEKREHWILYNHVNKEIYYTMWPKSNILFKIAPPWEMQKYVRIFADGKPTLAERLWLKLYRYELLDQ